MPFTTPLAAPMPTLPSGRVLFGAFELDLSTGELRSIEAPDPNNKVILREQVFQILRMLLEREGKIVTRDEIKGRLWPADTIVDFDHSINATINALRRALGDSGDDPRYIETLARRGYRFLPDVHEHLDRAGPLEPSSKLIGRSVELDTLLGCLENSLKGQAQIVFVTGEPGIGKTALVDEFRRKAAASGAELRVAGGQCTEGYGGTEAYYPVLQALRELSTGPGGSPLFETLVAQAPTWAIQFPSLLKREQREILQREIQGATRERMLREIGDAIEAITAKTQLLLIFEDIHWADPSTVGLISVLARRRTPAKLMIIGTYRPVDLFLAQHPLTKVKQDLALHRLCREMPLPALQKCHVAEFLSAELGSAEVPESLAELVYRHTEGNPLFIVTALEHMQQRGFISKDTGSLKLMVPVDEIDLEVPETLRQMIEAQIDRLSPEQQLVLELASLESAGRSRFAVAPRAAIGNLEPDAVEHVCETLARRHSILRSAVPERFSDGTVSACYEFVHVLYREVCYHRIAEGRRATLHRRLGEWLEVNLEPLGDVAALPASHFELGNDWSRAIKYLQLAADEASRRFEPRQAAEILEHALDLADRLSKAERDVSEIAILKKLTDAYIVFGIQFRGFASRTWPKFEDARIVEIQEALVARSAKLGLVDVEIAALIGLSFSNGWISSERCLAALDRALELSSIQESPLARARSRMICFTWRLSIGGWDRKDAEGCRNAIDEIRASGDGLALATHLIDFTIVRFHTSEYREGVRDIHESLKILSDEAAKDPHLISKPLGYLPMALHAIFLGRWGDALENVRLGIAFWDKNGNHVYARALRIHLAWLHLHAQDLDGVRAICESALPLVRLANDRFRPESRIYGHEFVMSLVMIGSAEAASGNHGAAYKYLVSAQEEMERETVAYGWYFRVLIEIAFVKVFLASGNLSEAQAHAKYGVELACATAEHTNQAFAWHASAQVAMAEGNFRRAQDDIAQALAVMEGYEVPLATWGVHATASELYQYLGDKVLAQQHRALSCETIDKIANSLPPTEPLRQTFLSAPRIREILGTQRF